MVGRKRAVEVKLSRRELDSQIDAFLKQGGQIEKIPTGKSGVKEIKGVVHIRIAK